MQNTQLHIGRELEGVENLLISPKTINARSRQNKRKHQEVCIASFRVIGKRQRSLGFHGILTLLPGELD